MLFTIRRVPPGDRREDRQVDSDVRHRRRRRPARGPGARRGRLPRAQSRQGLREPHHPRRRPAKAGSRRPATSAPTTSSPASGSGSSTRCRCPGEFGYETMPEGRLQVRRRQRTTGARCRSTRSAASSTSRRDRRTYDFYGADRIGTNLFANCLLALDARTGKRLWHFQTVHHDLWDLDNVSAPQLVTVRHNGRKVDAVAHAGKTGFPVRLQPRDRRAAVADRRAAGAEERRARRAVAGRRSRSRRSRRAFARQSFTVDDVNPWLLTPEEQAALTRARRESAERHGPAGRHLHPAGGRRGSIRCPATRADRTGARRRPIPTKGMVYVSGHRRGRDSQAAEREGHDAERPRRRKPGGSQRLHAVLPGVPRRQHAESVAGRAEPHGRDDSAGGRRHSGGGDVGTRQHAPGRPASRIWKSMR